jgi:hypothetical protein
MPIGLGGGGWVGWALESVMGTYVSPQVYIPIISEEFRYTEAKYYSPQIRQQTIVSDVQQGYYHIEGPIVMEVDPNFLPYVLYCSRHSIAKSGTGPYTYKFTPASFASAGTAATGAVPRTASVTISRNDQIFGYTGCVVGGYEATVQDGVDRVTLNMLGLAEATEAGPFTPAWVDPVLYGAATHSVYVDAAGLTPAFASPSVDHNGITITSNFNATAQNRIVRSRAATYIAFGETEAQYETELDFIDRTEYDNYVNTSLRAFRYESVHGADFATGTDGWRCTAYRSAYDAYDVNLPGMGDIIMATGVVGRMLGIAGGDAYSIEVKSAVSIT